MKPYRHTTKRIAKKKIGNAWKKLVFGMSLKPGDLISSCKGYNERILEITPEWSNYGLSKGKYLIDFNIQTASITGKPTGSCSLFYCCTTPTETKEEIIAYWTQSVIGTRNENYWDYILIPLKAGEEVFNEHGELLL